MMIGQVLSDRYEILEKIGEGGMAVAYRGRDRVLGRAVAVKVMRPELAADAEFLARFRREARAAAGIIHEHIAAVYDTGSDGPYHYIVMEYVPGESLKARLQREGPLSLNAALTIATATAEALEAAHS
ncbi:MAG: protein kinase, partial [Armatimonadota bacterium]